MFQYIRQNKNGGGVAIYIKQHIEAKLIETQIKDTIFTKVILHNNKPLYLITSYFPSIDGE